MAATKLSGYEKVESESLWRMLCGTIVRAEQGTSTLQGRTYVLAQLREARLMAAELRARGAQGSLF